MIPHGLRTSAGMLGLPVAAVLLRARAGERWCSLGKHWTPRWRMNAKQGNCRACDAARKKAAYRRARGIA